jgi:hypothetical protein
VGVDPFSLAVAVGTGAAGNLIAKAAEPAAEWLSERFRGHRPAAVAKAQDNSLEFLEKLGVQVRALEEAHPELKDQIDAALDDPAFSVLLQQALLTAAQTASGEKHDVLASLVANRLAGPQESLYAVASKLAVEAIDNLNERHLRLLGLIALLWGTRPRRARQTQLTYPELRDWLLARLAAFDGLTIKPLDLMHLESVSCAQRTALGNVPFPNLFQATLREGAQFDLDDFKQSPLGALVLTLWDEQGLGQYRPTSIGNLIGAFVFDRLTGSNTLLLDWD